MKKKLLAVSSLFIGAVTLFASVGCATTDISKIIPEKTTKSFNVETLKIDSSKNTSVRVDSNGMAIITTKNYNKKDVLVSNTYSLFNLKTNTTVYTEEFDVYESGDDEKYSEIKQHTSGFYYSTVDYYDYDGVLEETQYTLYDKTGEVFTNLEGSFSGGVFVDKLCNRYYLNIDGKIVKETNPLAIICSNPMKYGDYYVSNGFIFDEDGKLLRNSNNILAEMEIPETADGGATWNVGNYLFIQYRQLLAESEKNYDFIMSDGGLQKYDLVTKRYDLGKGKIKEIDLDFVVEATKASYNDESIILSGNKIVDKQVISNSIIQSFDKNGDVLTDLQKLVPGADEVVYASESALVLDDTAGIKYAIQKNKVVGTFPSGVSIADDLAILYNNGSLFFYGLDGSSKYTFHDVESYTAFQDGYIVRLSDSIYKYMVETNTVEKICSIDEDYYVEINSQYVLTFDTGAKKIVYDIYSLIPGIEDRLDLDQDEFNAIRVTSVGSYTIEVDEKTTISGTVYALREQDPKDDEETIMTYYNCYETVTKEKKGLFNS